MSRKPNTERRREEIITAMIKVVAEYGYEKATIQQIARAAKLTPGLIHYHFEEKLEILIAMARYLSDYGYQRFLRLSEDTAAPDERLRAYLEARLGFGKGASVEAVAAWVVIGAEATRQPQIADVYQAAIDFEMKLVRELLSQYCTYRRKSAAGAGRLAAVLLSFIEGAFQLSRTAGKVMPQRYAAKAAFQLVERFVAAEPSVR
jgi:TetR/AcrR family transcriptional regulator, transcriptional repressor of bet genes